MRRSVFFGIIQESGDTHRSLQWCSGCTRYISILESIYLVRIFLAGIEKLNLGRCEKALSRDR